MTIAIQSIALSKLVPSSANVRRTGTTERVEELAASIAAHGLLQNLTVRPTDTDRFEVIAGGRRLAALKLLVKQKQWPKNGFVPCQIIEGDNAAEISLAENALQCPMHPADQFEAFAELQRQGMGVEDIGARFGVSAKTIIQRLKLGAVSPKLMGIYRQGYMGLDQLSAFAITDDHALQERVWDELGFNRSRTAILHALNEGQVPSDDRRALYVGTEAYLAAGGTITHDLFDEEGGGFFQDASLLNRLVVAKLATEAEAITAEGWKWVEAVPALDYSMTASMRRVFPQTRELTAEEEERVEELSLQYETLSDQADEHEPDELDRMLREIDQAIDAIRGDVAYLDGDKAVAGAFVTLGSDGMPRVERGYTRREDQPARGAIAAVGDKPEKPKSDIPAKLRTELTAHRTAALANELAQSPSIALAALVHAMTARLLYVAPGMSCLDLNPHRTVLSSHAPYIGDSRAMTEIEARHAAWQQRLPQEAGDLWQAIVVLNEADRLDLLAHCVSLTLDAVEMPKAVSSGKARNADDLADALALDMTVYWQPTASGFFARLPKATIVKVVREGNCPESAQTLVDLKKPAMAERAEKLLAGKDWLPEVLRKARA